MGPAGSPCEIGAEEGSALSASSESPLVSVVTPFYNSADHLAECIESVLGQTLGDFEYVILDNGSTDGSADVVRPYAQRDARIRFLTPAEHLPQRPNYNRALRAISKGSRYCKMVQADDWIAPTCLERMVAVAAKSPRIRLVSSYCWLGDALLGGGLPVGQQVFDGADVCRRQILDGRFFFGSPTTVMYRSEDVLAGERFFDESAVHEDTMRCYELLAEGEMGFVHELLSYLRVDPASISGSARAFDPHGVDKLIVILTYGPRFLGEAEYRACRERFESDYYQDYVRGCIGPRGRAYRRYHRETFERAGFRHARSKVVRGALRVAFDAIGNPKLNVGRAIRALRSTRSDGAAEGPR